MIDLAVVPIFISAGAAVMPAIIGAAVSVVAIIFKPRELVRLLRLRPWTFAGSIGGLLLIGWIISALLAPNTQARAATRVAPTIDWAKVAEDILAQERAGKVPTILGGAVPTETSSTTALIQGRDVSRSSYAGGPSPIQLKPLWSFRSDDTMFL